MKKIQVNGGIGYERDIAHKTVAWCIKRLGLGRMRNLNVYVNIQYCRDYCAGYCEEGNNNRSYIITVANNQSLRDFVMTVVHEMVHVRQWVRNKWTGDGEEEAWRLQEKLTDELWQEDIL